MLFFKKRENLFIKMRVLYFLFNLFFHAEGPKLWFLIAKMRNAILTDSRYKPGCILEKFGAGF
ncbi:hypothetical protein DGG96_07945 [Legionella qingyii]|uniref:Uncharacterized protein n=1 Tax=Legionella qingyii TaxID=2184757 RepID=A0A317U791_9GAMM|nr:hypothetical protein DGG96_07945 [Legionella qingyii]